MVKILDKTLFIVIISVLLILVGCQSQNLFVTTPYEIDSSDAENIIIKDDLYIEYLVKRNTFIRMNDNATSEILLKISEGEVIYAIIKKQDKGWYKIDTLDGVRGYIFGDPLKIQD
jgi:uncharacterized protein YgiM (DUF1202 family)